MIPIDAFESLLQYNDLFTTTNNPFLYAFRFIGWWILRILAMMITAVEQAVNALFQNIDFLNSPEVMGLFDQLKPVAWGLMLIGVVLLFYGLMTNRVKSKGQIPFNFLCFFIIMIGLPSFLSQLNDLTGAGINTFKDTTEASMAQTVMDNAVQDLLYYDQNDFSDAALQNHNNIPTDKIEYINPVEQARPANCKNPEIFSNQLGIDSNGNYQLTQLGDGLFGWELLSSYYYRYKIDWIPLFISLFAMLIALVFSAIKIGKIIFELGYNVYVLLFVSAIDLTSGERTKRVCSEILSLFLVLIAIALLFRVYIIGVSWVARTFDGLAQAFAMFGFSWALIDGPNIIQKILGIDAGLSSAFHTVMGVYQGARMAAGLAKGTMHAAKTGMHAAAKAAGGVALATAAVGGYTAGKAKGIHDYVKEKQEAAKNQGRAGTVYGYSSFDRTLNAGEHPPKLGDGKQPEANGAPPVEPRSHGTPGMDTSQSEHSEAQNSDRSKMDMPDSAAQQTASAPPEQPEAKNEQPNEHKGRVPDRTTTLGGIVQNKLNHGMEKASGKMQNNILTRSYDVGRNTAIAALHTRDEVFNRMKNKFASAYDMQQHAGFTPTTPPSRPTVGKNRRLPEQRAKALKEGGKKRGGNQSKS